MPMICRLVVRHFLASAFLYLSSGIAASHSRVEATLFQVSTNCGSVRTSRRLVLVSARLLDYQYADLQKILGIFWTDVVLFVRVDEEIEKEIPNDPDIASISEQLRKLRRPSFFSERILEKASDNN